MEREVILCGFCESDSTIVYKGMPFNDGRISDEVWCGECECSTFINERDKEE